MMRARRDGDNLRTRTGAGSAGGEQHMDDRLGTGIDTVFLDAGNTLISMDYAWIAAELRRRGLDVAVADLARAEAAARPATSRFVAGMDRQSGVDAFVFYLHRILERLPGARAVPSQNKLVLAVAAALKSPRGDHRLWSVVLEGVPEALEALRSSGRRLVVVSNSDGSVERALTDTGLAARIDVILDSEIVGFEKPDPRLFEHALEVAGARREATLHVGDMYFQDVLGARAAGIDSVLLDPFDDWLDADCPRRRDLADVAAELTGRAD
jgi:HAD superfamily hydrolase (TIGR01509 family)